MTGNETYLDQLVDEDTLRAYLTSTLGEADRYRVEHLAEGHSNETLFVTWGERDLVMRRPPAGETAESAHDVLREHRVISALQGTDVPVPTPVLACDDASVIGGEFYLMERLDGDVIRGREPDRFATPEHRRRIAEELIDTLAAIHTLDYEAVGLGDLGRPEGYTERQVERWGKQFDWAYETTREDREVPHVGEIGEWLAANVPESYEHTFVHGDYKLDNVMFAPGTPPRINAVMDWEMGTLGDPLRDVGWMLCYWDVDPLSDELMPTFIDRPGYLDREALIDRYERRSGIEFVHREFYVVLGLYMLAAVCEMFYARYLNGNSDDDLYPKMETLVPRICRRAKALVDGKRTV
ncbi:phosphotransferase family protein [Halomarina halobia]|uniref:Phosphotransferase family protein n=1 Tax=Halomarina halobia TaxID=3033386 RepID=A0ABD6ADZ4_9EURY|nr:phosphotransferase family protein [Halomarina sp. PSR21]